MICINKLSKESSNGPCVKYWKYKLKNPCFSICFKEKAIFYGLKENGFLTLF